MCLLGDSWNTDVQHLVKSFSKFNSYEKVKEGINNDSSRTSAKNDAKDIF
jgi:hypothetical protein